MESIQQNEVTSEVVEQKVDQGQQGQQGQQEPVEMVITKVPVTDQNIALQLLVAFTQLHIVVVRITLKKLQSCMSVLKYLKYQKKVQNQKQRNY